jgi:hypothetical protein
MWNSRIAGAEVARVMVMPGALVSPRMVMSLSMRRADGDPNDESPTRLSSMV